MRRVTLLSLSCQGGMLHYTSQLANSLSKTVKVTVIIPEHTETKLFLKGIRIIKLRTGHSLLEYAFRSLLPHTYRSIIRSIRDSKPDILHIVSSHPWNIAVAMLPKLYKVFTLHDPQKHKGEFILSLFLSDKITMRISDRIIVHGHYWKEYLEAKGYSSKKIVTINHGDYSFFTKWKRGEKLSESSNNVLFFGRIEEYKGIRYLCEAEPLISEYIPNLSITIAGKGDIRVFRDYIVNPERYQILNKYIDDEEVSALFEKCSCVVLPYIDGSQTGIIPIAYAFKKPVVVTNVTALPEVVDEGITGYIVPPKAPTALSEAIIKVLSNKEKLLQMGLAAHDKMRNELSWEKISEQTLKLYDELIGIDSNKRQELI